MRILAVAKVAGLRVRVCRAVAGRVARQRCPGYFDMLHRHRDHAVVLRGVEKDLLHQPEAEVQRRAAGPVELLEHPPIVVRTDDHQDVDEILGRGAQQARTADVDLFDQLIERRIRVLGRLAERIEVDHHEVDRRDPVCGDGGEILLAVAAGEDAAVHRRMERLDPTVQHLGEAGDVGDVDHREPDRGDRFRGATGRDELDPPGHQPAGELGEPGFVRHTQDCAHGDDFLRKPGADLLGRTTAPTVKNVTRRARPRTASRKSCPRQPVLDTAEWARLLCPRR